MKRLWNIILVFICCASLLSGCASTDAGSGQVVEDDGKIHVVTTIFPPYDFVREIAGDAVDVKMLLSPGAESHSFEPTPQDIIAIRNCDVFIYAGGESDQWVDSILDSIDTSDIQVIALTSLVETVAEEIVEGMQSDHSHDEEEDHDHEDDYDHNEEEDHDHEDDVELDEHVWTSPKNAQIIVEAIGEVLAALDAENALLYRQNAVSYIEKLVQLDEAFQAIMAEAVRDTVVFGDRFPFRYFADYYGLQYFAAFPGCSTETEASAATVAFLIRKVQEEDIPVVFFIEFSNEKMADVICEATGAKKLLLHSCHNVSRDDLEAGVGYLELMTQNVAHLKEALQ